MCVKVLVCVGGFRRSRWAAGVRALALSPILAAKRAKRNAPSRRNRLVSLSRVLPPPPCHPPLPPRPSLPSPAPPPPPRRPPTRSLAAHSRLYPDRFSSVSGMNGSRLGFCYPPSLAGAHLELPSLLRLSCRRVRLRLARVPQVRVFELLLPSQRRLVRVEG